MPPADDTPYEIRTATPEDTGLVEALDGSFTTATVFRVEMAENGFTLRETPVDPPLTKVFPEDENDEGSGAQGDEGSGAQGDETSGPLGGARPQGPRGTRGTERPRETPPSWPWPPTAPWQASSPSRTRDGTAASPSRTSRSLRATGAGA